METINIDDTISPLANRKNSFGFFAGKLTPNNTLNCLKERIMDFNKNLKAVETNISDSIFYYNIGNCHRVNSMPIYIKKHSRIKNHL